MTLSDRSRHPLLGCISSTFDRPVEKHCNRLCLTHRRVMIGSTQRSIEILSYIKKLIKKSAGIGLDRYWPILRICGIGSVLKKWYRCIPRSNQSKCVLEQTMCFSQVGRPGSTSFIWQECWSRTKNHMLNTKFSTCQYINKFLFINTCVYLKNIIPHYHYIKYC